MRPAAPPGLLGRGRGDDQDLRIQQPGVPVHHVRRVVARTRRVERVPGLVRGHALAEPERHDVLVPRGHGAARVQGVAHVHAAARGVQVREEDRVARRGGDGHAAVGEGRRAALAGRLAVQQQRRDAAAGFVVSKDFQPFSQKNDIFCRSFWDSSVQSRRTQNFWQGFAPFSHGGE